MTIFGYLLDQLLNRIYLLSKFSYGVYRAALDGLMSAFASSIVIGLFIGSIFSMRTLLTSLLETVLSR